MLGAVLAEDALRSRRDYCRHGSVYPRHLFRHRELLHRNGVLTTVLLATDSLSPLLSKDHKLKQVPEWVTTEEAGPSWDWCRVIGLVSGLG